MINRGGLLEMAKNGYAQLVVKGSETHVVVFPPEEGGKQMDVNELTAYLDRNQISGYDLKALSKACSNKEASTEVFVGVTPYNSYNETMDVDVSMDKMLVFCKFFPASEGGSLMTEREILSGLNSNKINFGVDMEAIHDWLANREYNKEFVFAKGKPARQGTDGKIEYFFNTSLSTKPKKNEDGTVNYHELNTVSLVTKGQKLAQAIPADPGEEGKDVFGNPIKPRNVKEAKLQFGNNITLSEDGNSIYSDVTGHATLTSGKVFVSDVLEIPADVDTSTGDIEYDGCVHVKGNVKSGFKIVAKGDIIVEGVVEGALLRSDGQIIIKQGIHGMNKGALDAKGNIICKFMESAKILCGGYVETEGIVHCKVSAFTEVHVHGKKGMIMGGTVRAGNLVETDTLGSEMGAQTVIEVGADPKKKAQYMSLQNLIKDKKAEIEKVKPILATFSEKINSGVELPPDKLQYVQKLAATFKVLKQELMTYQDDYEKLHSEISTGTNARVKVNNKVFPGVTIVISDVSYTTKDTRSFCQYVKESGDVVCKNL